MSGESWYDAGISFRLNNSIAIEVNEILASYRQQLADGQEPVPAMQAAIPGDLTDVAERILTASLRYYSPEYTSGSAIDPSESFDTVIETVMGLSRQVRAVQYYLESRDDYVFSNTQSQDFGPPATEETLWHQQIFHQARGLLAEFANWMIYSYLTQRLEQAR